MPVPRPLCAAIVVAAALATSATACSSSSSPSPSSSAARAALALESAHAVPAEAFHRVSPSQAKSLERVLPLQRGVKSETYDPATLVLEVTFRSTANKLDQQNVENLVRQSKQAKQGKRVAGATSSAKGHPAR